MRDPIHEVNQLLDEATELSMGPARVAMIERAVRIADGIPDDELAFGARMELVTTATFAGMPQRSLVAFAWLLGKCDAEPDRFDVEDLLFPYRWIVEDVPYLIDVSAERVDALIDDMEARYRRAWWWEHPVAEARLRWSIVRGSSTSTVEGHFDTWRREFGRSGNRMGGHEIHATVITLCYLERWREAIETARPSIDGVVPAEDEYPARTFAALVQPARKLDLPQREAWRARSAELCASNQVFIREVSAIVDDFCRAGDEPPISLIDDLEQWLKTSRDDHGIMLASAALARAGRDDADEHRRRAVSLAARFDERHGNDMTSRLVHERL